MMAEATIAVRERSLAEYQHEKDQSGSLLRQQAIELDNTTKEIQRTKDTADYLVREREKVMIQNQISSSEQIAAIASATAQERESKLSAAFEKRLLEKETQFKIPNQQNDKLIMENATVIVVKIMFGNLSCMPAMPSLFAPKCTLSFLLHKGT